jgi:hypothetical protein
VSTTATVLLRVNPLPSPASPSDLEVCDLDNDGFIIKESLENGFSAGGCCCEPKDVASTVRESTGMILSVLQKNS